MTIIKEMITDDVINKSELILKKYYYLGLDKTQAKFLSKIFENRNINFSRIDIKTISKLLSIDEDASKIILQKLIEKNCIRILNENNKILFNFEILIEKLLKSYFVPLDCDSISEKIKWLKNKIKFSLNNENELDLIKFIKEKKWDKIILVVEKIKNYDEANWPLFVTMINAISKKTIKNNEKLKLILEQNWLEE